MVLMHPRSKNSLALSARGTAVLLSGSILLLGGGVSVLADAQKEQGYSTAAAVASGDPASYGVVPPVATRAELDRARRGGFETIPFTLEHSI